MTIYYRDDRVTLHHGDCIEVMASLPDASVDAVVTDPPYGLEFMGKSWDKFAAPSKGRADLVEHSNFTAKKSKFKDGVGTQVGMPKKNPRCRACSRLKFDKPASKCVCGAPDWDTRTREYAQDFQEWCELWTAECLRVLKPGGHLLAFGGTRTWHRLACAVEDAGFEVRDSIAWMYGSGFPKSLDVSKAIDKAAGAEREVVGIGKSGRASRPADETQSRGVAYRFADDAPITAPATPDAERWQGWGTALKPAFEPVVVARKPLAGTVAANVLAWGTGALNIDGCRVGVPSEVKPQIRATTDVGGGSWSKGEHTPFHYPPGGGGRWPANVVLDESQAAALDEQSGDRPGDNPNRKPRQNTAEAHNRTVSMGRATEDWTTTGHADIGGASRFFYVAKADATERPRVNGTDRPQQRVNTSGRWPANVVLDESQAEALDEQSGTSKDGVAVKRNRPEDGRAPYAASSYMITDSSREDHGYGGQGGASRFFYVAKAPATERPRVNGTAHPTVKPLSLMRWLVRLVTPPGGTVLEPFAGSGTTVEACLLEGFHCIAIEKTGEYLPLTVARIYRQRHPVEAVKLAGEELGLFAHIDEEVTG